MGERRDGALAVAETKERAADPALRQAIFSGGDCIGRNVILFS